MAIINELNYVDEAEKVIKRIEGKYRNQRNSGKNIITTSQIRNILAKTAELYNRVLSSDGASSTLDEDILGEIEYLRVNFVYQAGREKSVKEFVDEAKILEILRNIKDSKKDFLTFCRYMEALVAFRKYHIKDDK